MAANVLAGIIFALAVWKAVDIVRFAWRRGRATTEPLRLVREYATEDGPMYGDTDSMGVVGGQDISLTNERGGHYRFVSCSECGGWVGGEPHPHWPICECPESVSPLAAPQALGGRPFVDRLRHEGGRQ